MGNFSGCGFFFFFRALSRSSKQPGCLAPARRAAPRPRARLPGSLTYPKSLTYGFYITWLRRRLLRRKRAYFPLSFHAPLGTGCSALARPRASPCSPLGHGSPPRPRILAGVLQEMGRSASRRGVPSVGMLLPAGQGWKRTQNAALLPQSALCRLHGGVWARGWAGLGCRGSSPRPPVPVAVASDLSTLS